MHLKPLGQGIPTKPPQTIDSAPTSMAVAATEPAMPTMAQAITVLRSMTLSDERFDGRAGPKKKERKKRQRLVSDEAARWCCLSSWTLRCPMYIGHGASSMRGHETRHASHDVAPRPSHESSRAHLSAARLMSGRGGLCIMGPITQPCLWLCDCAPYRPSTESPPRLSCVGRAEIAVE